MRRIGKIAFVTFIILNIMLGGVLKSSDEGLAVYETETEKVTVEPKALEETEATEETSEPTSKPAGRNIFIMETLDQFERDELQIPMIPDESEVIEKREFNDIAADVENGSQDRLGQITESSDTSERIWAIMEYLISEGFTPEAAAAVVGNIAVESCFDPAVISQLGNYGLFQWNTSSGGGYWWYDVENWLAENGYDWSSFEGQMKAMLYCSNRGFLNDSCLETLKSMTNVEQAVELFAVFYEGCVGGSGVAVYYNAGTCYQGLDTRKSEAWVAYYMYMGGSMEYTGQKSYS